MSMRLSEGRVNSTYMVSKIDAEEGGMEEFLFTLGCYPGEPVTIISRLKNNMIITVKDARYSIDSALAHAICV
ncbi:MAG: ferrous iron transport protein A [Sphaerochaetaceae bacterium]|nr:ferrous iron transport protein A [Sphaerochaetaceae bacterium]